MLQMYVYNLKQSEYALEYKFWIMMYPEYDSCLLYTSDAADE